MPLQDEINQKFYLHISMQNKSQFTITDKAGLEEVKCVTNVVVLM